VGPVADHVRPDRREGVFVNTGADTVANFRYRSYGELTGRLVDDRGQPVAGGLVIAILAGGASINASRDADGIFKMRGPPGTYTVRVTPPPGHGPPADVTGVVLVQAGRTD